MVNPMPRRDPGFTLIELLVVLAIVALLLSLATPRYFQHIERTKEAVLRENVAALRESIDQYHADTGVWPGSLQVLAEQRYLRQVPIDPLTERSDTWKTRLSTPLNEQESSGIIDIYSGAEGHDRQGKAYADY